MRTIPPKLLKYARGLRVTQTPWETRLWYYLRAKRIFEYKFKRQVRIDNYIVDFCCRERMLIIELDGGQHNVPAAIKSDIQRQKYLEGLGYKVLRFWNNQLDENIDGVLEVIRQALD